MGRARAGVYEPRPSPSLLFTGVRGRIILRTSPRGGSRKFAYTGCSPKIAYCPGGGGISRPYLWPISTILPTSGSPSGAEDPSVAGSPASRKNLSKRANRRDDRQNPAGRGPHVPERVQGALGGVHARPHARGDGALAEQELDLPLQHAERLVLVGVQVRGGAAPPRGWSLPTRAVGRPRSGATT